MSNALAIPTQTPAAPPPAPRGVQWIDVKTASKRMAVAERTITRLCGDKWVAVGLAKFIPPAGGRGKAEWTIREDANPKLARVLFPDQLPADLKSLTDVQRDHVRCKRAILAAWDTFAASDQYRDLPRELVDADFLRMLAADRLPIRLEPAMRLPTDRTLRNWRSAFRNLGLEGLIDGRGPAKKKPVDDDPFSRFSAGFTSSSRTPDVRFCWRVACMEAEKNGWMKRSLPQTYRYQRTIPRPVLDKFRGGETHYNDRSAGYIERDYTGLKSNEVWTGDHHQMDVMVTHQGRIVRPWLTVFQDVRSRKIVGWHFSAVTGNTDTILFALAMGIDSHGVPLELYVDNGKDYDSHALQGRTKRQRRAGEEADTSTVNGVCGSLGIKVTHCWPYHGQSKPVERFFGTLESRFGKTHATYCGKSPADRPENLQAKLARGAAPTLADLAERFGAWLAGDYHSVPHTGNGMVGRTPSAVFDECLDVKRVVPAGPREIMLWKQGRPTKVGRNGVRFGGLTYGLNDPAVIRWMGKEVSLRLDPADVNRVAVCELSGKFICIATCNQRLPFRATAAEASKAIGNKKRRRKVVNEYHEQRPRLQSDTVEEMWNERADQAKREREANPPAAPTVSIVKTPMDDQLPLLEKALRGSGPRLAGSTPKRGLLDSILDEPEPPTTFKTLRSIFELDRKKADENPANLPAETSFRDLYKHFEARAVGDE